MCENCQEMSDALKEVNSKLNALNERQFFLKESLKELIADGIKVNLETLKVKQGDVIVFNIPDELTYDPDFFTAIQPIFQEINVSVVALHKGITLKSIIKEEYNG